MTTLLTLGALGAGLFVATTFVVVYSILQKWWQSLIGWLLVSLVFCCAGLIANGLVSRLFGNYPGRAQVSLGFFLTIDVVLVILTVKMIKLNLKKNDIDKAEADQ